MTDASQYAVRDGIAVITLNNPPVNGLSNALRSGVMQALQRAEADAAVKAVVIIGSAKAFSGGADIREFNAPRLKPALSKPLVAAIGGFALGGGLELALACHYRVAAPRAQLGLPEVKLGLLPGSGGTQRLPRAIPVAEAVKMMTTGNPISSERARELGLVDELVQGELLEAAIAFARAALGKELPRIRDRKTRLEGDPQAFFAQVREQVAKESKGYPAPLLIVECAEAAVTRPFDEGRKLERASFDKLVSGPESKALRHIFFAERQTSKIPDVPEDTPVREINTAAVVGAGTMGGGIAMNFANAAIPVTLVDMTQEALDRGLKTIRKNYEATVSKGRLAQTDMDRRMSLIHSSTRLGDIAQADIVIEAVFERMDVKQDLFKKLDGLVKPGAILATNTSTLDVDRIAEATTRAPDVIGTHFFSPANVMRLLEVVRGKHTTKEVLATTMKLGKRLKKVPVVAGVCDGFIGNRMCATASSATACSKNTASRACFWSTRGRARSRSTARCRIGAWPWVPSPCTTWRARTSAGRSASAATGSGPTSCIRASPTACASSAASGRRPARASTGTKLAAASPSSIQTFKKSLKSTETR
jgi:3-hydroxyacyl-CoA dehydrogenase